MHLPACRRDQALVLRTGAYLCSLPPMRATVPGARREAGYLFPSIHFDISPLSRKHSSGTARRLIRAKLSRARLAYAVSEGTEAAREAVEAAIEALVARKLLLHRRRVDDISVWHGADIDLGQMVAEEAARLAIDSDPVAALERMFPPDAYTAPPYNHARGIIPALAASVRWPSSYLATTLSVLPTMAGPL